MQVERARQWRVVALLLLGLLATNGVTAQSQTSDAAERFDCQVLAQWAMPDTAWAWLERSLWAGHCYVFRGQAVRAGHDGVRALVLTHRIHNGIEYARARFLDGPSLTLEHEGRIGRLPAERGEPLVARPAVVADHLAGLYRLQLGGEDRIANRRTQLLDIAPLDSLRFGYRLWLDMATGLPLKQVLIDDKGQVVETFQFTELDDPRLHPGYLLLDRPQPPPPTPWVIGWLPDGFVPQPSDAVRLGQDDDVVHRLYSDGLATLSLFVEPIDNTPLLAPGIHRLGVSRAAVRHRELGGRPRQVVAMGELPARVLLQVVDTLEWQSPPAASVGGEAVGDKLHTFSRRSSP